MASDETCAVCGATFQRTGREKWCASCIAAHSALVRKMVRFDEIYTHLRLALQAMDDWVNTYPDAASLVEQSRPELKKQLHAASVIRRSLHAQEETMVMSGH